MIHHELVITQDKGDIMVSSYGNTETINMTVEMYKNLNKCNTYTTTTT